MLQRNTLSKFSFRFMMMGTTDQSSMVNVLGAKFGLFDAEPWGRRPPANVAPGVLGPIRVEFPRFRGHDPTIEGTCLNAENEIPIRPSFLSGSSRDCERLDCRKFAHPDRRPHGRLQLHRRLGTISDADIRPSATNHRPNARNRRDCRPAECQPSIYPRKRGNSAYPRLGNLLNTLHEEGLIAASGSLGVGRPGRP